jgi:hypothetical protein
MKPEIKCCVCERPVEQKKQAQPMKPPAPVICGAYCAKRYNGALLVKAMSYGLN